MAERDIYAPCICGSGKKLKFCCLPVIAEVERLRILVAEGRFELALQAAKELLENPRATSSTRCFAHTICAKVLQFADPQQALAEIDAALQEDPDSSSAKFERVAVLLKTTPPAELAESIDELILSIDLGSENNGSGNLMFDHFFNLLTTLLMAHQIQGEILAANACLEQLRQLLDDETFQSIAKMARHLPALPYALRGGDCHWQFQGDERFRAEFEVAESNAMRGAYFDAARRFGDLARQDPQNATFLFNSGISRAYAGESVQAIEILRSVARMNIDFESAVECEILAWSLEGMTRNSPKRSSVEQIYVVDNVSQVLGILDSLPTIQPEIEEPASPSSEGIKLPREYSIINRPVPDGSPLNWTAEEIPVMIGAAKIGTSKPDTSGSDEPGPATVELLIEFEDIPEAHAVAKNLEQQLGDSVRLKSTRTFECMAFLGLPYLFFPKDIEYSVTYHLLRLHRQRILQHVQRKDFAPPLLRGQTLAELAQQPDQKIRLAAALFLISQQSGFVLDSDDLRQRFGLPATERLRISEETRPGNLSALQIARLDLADLTDEQCYEALNVCHATNYVPGIYRAGVECFTREFAEIPPDSQAAFRKTIAVLLSENCLLQGHLEEALAWTTKARQYIDPNNRIQENILLDKSEVKIRAANPADPQLIPKAQALWRIVKAKLPEAIPQLQQYYLFWNIPGEWDPTSLVSATGEALTSQGPGSLWTPGSESGTSAGKLWLPGQD